MHNVIERYVSSEERYVTYDFTDDLATGETIVSASWTPTDPICQYVAASSSISADGKSVSAKFRHLGEGDALVNVVITTTGVTEVIEGQILFKQISVPGEAVPEGMIPAPPYERLFYATAYGADPDGLQDSTIAIRNAVAAAYAAGGGTVFFPRGTYLFSTGALLEPGTGYSCVWITYPHVRWRGEGLDLSILKLMNAQPVYKAVITSHWGGADNFEIAGLTIDQNFSNNSHNGSDMLTNYRMAVAIFSGNNVHIHDCRFTNYSSLNCVVVNGSAIKGARITGNTFDNYGGATGEHDHSGIYSHNKDCLIEGNRFEGIAGGKGVVCAIEVHGDKQLVLNNRMKQVHTGINLTGVASSSVGSIVANNTIEDCRFGIHLYSGSTDGSTVGLEQALISQNTIILNPDMWYNVIDDGVFVRGIGLAGGWDLAVRDVIISENVIKLKPFTSPTVEGDANGSAISFYDPLPNGVQHQRLKIINNVVDGSMVAGIRVTMDVLDFEIAGNQIRNVGLAANVNSGYKCGIFMTGPSAKYGRVHDNSILDDQATPTTSNLIYLSPDAVTDCECVDNRTFSVNPAIGHIYAGDAYAKAWLIRHSLPAYGLPAYPARPGSVLTDLSNGKEYVQIDSSGGNKWLLITPTEFNVMAYGAKGDDTTDDSAAIQAAINAAAGVKGVIYFPNASGYYLGSTTLTLAAGSNGVTFRGESKDGVKLRYTGSSHALDIGSASADTRYLRFENFTILGSGSGAVGLYLRRVKNSSLYNVYISGFSNTSTPGQGLRTDGNGSYTGDNFFRDLHVDACQECVALTTISNANHFNGGTLRATKSHASARAINGSSGNGNTFAQMDIENCTTGVRCGSAFDNNAFDGLRFENNTTAIHLESGAAKNHITNCMDVLDNTTFLNNASGTTDNVIVNSGTRPTITGSRGGNAALASLLTQLASLGLIIDGTSA